MDTCLIWPGATAGKGYGVRCIGGKMRYVHRLVAEAAYGPIPKGMVVAHSCDNPRCFNLAHLFICTQKENLADMKRKGRSAHGDKHRSKKYPHLVLRGEQIGGSKLTMRQVAEIRTKYIKGSPGIKSPVSLSGLALEYGVSFQTIHKIINGKLWAHL